MLCRRLVVVACAVVLAGPGFAQQQQAEKIFTIEGGGIYHREHCPNLAGHKVVAVARESLPRTAYACHMCRPDGNRCQFTIIGGPDHNTQCKRPAMRNGYCDQHGGLIPDLPRGTASATPAQRSATPAAAATDIPSDAAAQPGIRSKCAGEWPEDFRMRAFCEKQQREALATLRNRAMSSTDERTIRNHCQKEWADDFRMRNFCEEQQLKALGELR